MEPFVQIAHVLWIMLCTNDRFILHRISEDSMAGVLFTITESRSGALVAHADSCLQYYCCLYQHLVNLGAIELCTPQLPSSIVQ